MPGIRFDVIVGAKLYAVVTDANGEIRLCFEGPVRVTVYELVRETGGQWSPTTPLPAVIDLVCSTVDFWVGNVRTKVPDTGAGGLGASQSPASRSAPAANTGLASPRVGGGGLW